MELNKYQKSGSITLSGRCCWEKRYPVWGQLTYNEGNCSKFLTIVWRDNSLRAHIMSPYLCYSGSDPIVHSALSVRDTATILWIAAKTTTRNIIRYTLPKYIDRAIMHITDFIYWPVKTYKNHKEAKEFNKFWESLK
jgi:hypothetical protein